MVVGDNEIGDNKNEGNLLAILIAMQTRRYNREINLIVLLLVFLTNRLPAVANGDRNSIHYRHRAPQTYD